MKRHTRAGLLVIGDELLCGKRRDRHLEHTVEVLQPRGMQIAWCHYAGDGLSALADTLHLSRRDAIPVFCFGGIGPTPDDRTRQAAAQAFGMKLARNPEAARNIEARFGPGTTPGRLRMADLPQNCRLIPNPVNGIPGFSLDDHHFFPGFPQLAWPMLDWVLDSYYPQHQVPLTERSLRVTGTPESALIDLMESLVARHPKTRLFSLPQLGEHHCTELGFRGERQYVEAAMADLTAALTARSLVFEFLSPEDLRHPVA